MTYDSHIWGERRTFRRCIRTSSSCQGACGTDRFPDRRNLDYVRVRRLSGLVVRERRTQQHVDRNNRRRDTKSGAYEYVVCSRAGIQSIDVNTEDEVRCSMADSTIIMVWLDVRPGRYHRRSMPRLLLACLLASSGHSGHISFVALRCVVKLCSQALGGALFML